MNKTNDDVELEDDESLAKTDYLGGVLALPKDISEAIENEKYIITKDAKLSWDGRQLMVRIPLEITNEMGINKENKSDYIVNFNYIKPAPDSTDEKEVTIKLIKAL